LRIKEKFIGFERKLRRLYPQFSGLNLHPFLPNPWKSHISKGRCTTMPGDFLDPTPEEQNIVLIELATLRNAERFIESCEFCNPAASEIPFDHILDEITGSDPTVTDYLLEKPAKCPNCRRDVVEKTLVEAA